MGTPRKQQSFCSGQVKTESSGQVWGLEPQCLPTPPVQEHRGLLALRYPMEHGVVRDWNDMERIWQYVYSKDQLQTFSEEVWQPGLPQAPNPLSVPSLLCSLWVRLPHILHFAVACRLFTVLGAQQSVAAKQKLPESGLCGRVTTSR